MERVEHDYYPTPFRITEILASKIGHLVEPGSYILDPCAGHGAILGVLEELLDCHGISNEPNPKELCPMYFFDATVKESWERLAFNHRLDWIVTNPPYDKNRILPIMQHSMNYCQKGLAALVRLSWLEPCRDRAEFLQSNSDRLRYLIPVSPRPRFRADTSGSDNVTSCWLVWDKSWSWQAQGIDCPFVFAGKWKA